MTSLQFFSPFVFQHVCFMSFRTILMDLLSATAFQCSDWKPRDLPETLVFGGTGQLLPSGRFRQKKRNRKQILCCPQIELGFFFLMLGRQQEKGNTPLHIAARAGQILQAELLAVYGADPGALDSSGKTPTDYAR